MVDYGYQPLFHQCCQRLTKSRVSVYNTYVFGKKKIQLNPILRNLMVKKTIKHVCLDVFVLKFDWEKKNFFFEMAEKVDVDENVFVLIND